MTSELLRALLVAVAFAGVLVTAEAWHRCLRPPVEWTRKFAHFAGGLVVAAFPWIFQSAWSIVALALVFAGVMRWTRRRGLLAGIHGVERRSEGDLFYLVAVCLLFLVGRGTPVFYLISILVLVVADTAAALLGSRYGKWTYSVEGDTRTLEGSGVFFLTSFLSVHLPLLLLTDLDRAACVLISVQLALLVTSFEAISLRGNDNLVVPLATFCLLVKMTPYSAAWIAGQLAAQVIILGVLALLALRSRLLSLSGVVAAHLFFYGAWALGGPQWLVAPVLALVVGAAAWRQRRGEADQRQGWQVAAVFYTTLAALLLYVADDLFQTLLPGPEWLRRGHPFYAPYVGALAAQLAILLHLRHRGRVRGSGGWALLLGVAGVVLPGLALGPGGVQPVGVMTAIALCTGALAAFCAAEQTAGSPLKPLSHLRLQAASVVGCALLLLPALLWWTSGAHAF